MIVAGPGSGKTFTLVERVLNLIQNHNVAPENILVSTFTEKAAKELLTRISNRLLSEGLHVNPNALAIGTLHSICLDILDRNREFTRLKRSFTLMDQFDQQYFVYPDFLIKKKDGSYVLVEIKGDNKIDDEVVRAKAKSATEMASASMFSYEMIRGSEASRGLPN